MLFSRRSTPAGATERDLKRVDARWFAHNDQFAVNDNHGPDRGSCVLVRRGGRPLVFCAPHAVHHYRAGALKTNDVRTGGLALALAEHLGGSAVALRRGGTPEFGDPNADLEHPLKTEAAPLVLPGVTLVDVHGMADRAEDVLIGLGPAPTERSHRVAESFVAAGRLHGITAAVADGDSGFGARGPATITAWATGRGALAFQFEIARRLRTAKAPAEQRHALLHTFVDVFA